MSAPQHTPGPWPWEYTGDGKRIVIGEGLVEGPNGYEVAEVYSDDCPRELAEANARLIAAAPELLAALQAAVANSDDLEAAGHVRRRDTPAWRIYQQAVAAIAKATGAA